jgi:hypothetical protein
MKSLVTKRSIVIAGHKTSVSLEDAFWTGLKEIAIAAARHCRTSSPRSIPDAHTAIYRRPSGCSCSTTTGRKPTVTPRRAAIKRR